MKLLVGAKQAEAPSKNRRGAETTLSSSTMPACNSAASPIAPTAECQGYMLVITGHSLGAGIAALLALILRKAWQGNGVEIICSAFSPPGGLLSKRVAVAMGPWCTSVFVENDLVPTLGLAQVELLMDEVVHALVFSPASKFALSTSACACSQKAALALLPPPPPLMCDAVSGALRIDWGGCGSAPSEAAAAALALHRAAGPVSTRASRASLASHISHEPLFPPGRVVQLRKHAKKGGRYMAEELSEGPGPILRIRWPFIAGVLDHLPWNVLRALREGQGSGSMSTVQVTAAAEHV